MPALKTNLMTKEHINMHSIELSINNLVEKISELDLDTKIELINNIKIKLHGISPFKNEPVDCVLWIKNNTVKANDYNPNKVAPPEMELLEISIMNDGYTQPIVTWETNSAHEVIDGFHRHRVGKESKIISNRVMGYLPIVEIRKEQSSKNDRIASTIRHNRARGKHQVDAMSEIVIELKNRNWKNERIAKELGMDEDEILRLCQISGLQELFKDDDFSKSWNIDDSEIEYEDLTDCVEDEEKEQNNFKTINTSDENRIFHTYDKWECFKAGFYNSIKEGMTSYQCEQQYYEVLTSDIIFSLTLEKIITEWKYSCEHYLTNNAMNRIAWLGQAAVCYVTGVPSKFCSGWNLLSKEQQDNANNIALIYLNKWLKANGLSIVDLNEALSLGRQINIY